MRITPFILTGSAVLLAVFGIEFAQYLNSLQRTSNVLVATHTLAPYVQITSADVSLQPVSTQDVHSGTITSMSAAIGQYTTMSIVQGSQVQSSEVGSSGNPVLQVAKLPNELLVNVPIGPTDVGTFITPGMKVDLFGIGGSQGGQSLPYVPNVLVLQTNSQASALGQPASAPTVLTVEMTLAQYLVILSYISSNSIRYAIPSQ